LEIFSQSDSRTILVSAHHNCNIPAGTPNRGIKCRWDMKKIASFDQQLASLRVVNGVTITCHKHSAARPWQVGNTHCW